MSNSTTGGDATAVTAAAVIADDAVVRGDGGGRGIQGSGITCDDSDDLTGVNSITLATALAETSGGTGTGTYVTGNILYADGANSLTKLAVGSNTEVLTLAAGIPSWAAATSGFSGTAGSVIFYNGSALAEDNANFFWDDTNNRLGIGTTTPTDDLGVVGSIDLIHTSLESNDHALEIEVDAAGFFDVKAIEINYVTGALAANEEDAIISINVDETGASGGELFGLEILSTAVGGVIKAGLKVGTGIGVVSQSSGVFVDADSILNKAVDVTAALANGGAGNISVFVADNDTVTIGDAAKFEELEIIIDTAASGGGIAPTFEYSTGSGTWANFGPIDGTNGLRNTGNIAWQLADVTGWMTSGGEYLLRWTRTRNSLGTTPIIDEIQIAADTEFAWDKNGDVNINSLTLLTDLAASEGGTGSSTLTQGSVSNLGIDYNGGTGVFTVQGATAALSSTNVGNVVLQSKADPGELVAYTVTAGQSFIDDVGASEILNNLFGLTTAVAYGEDIPFFLYAVGNDDEDTIAFMISRVPEMTTSPAAANIGAPDDAVADAQADFWSLDSLDETLYDSNPCLMIGSFRMQMSASDDWTVQTLDNGDGIGLFQYGRNFTFALGTFGATAGTFFLANGGTPPVFTTNDFIYYLAPGKLCQMQFGYTGDGGTDGSGIVIAQFAIPYIPEWTGNHHNGFGNMYATAAALAAQNSMFQLTGSVNYFQTRGQSGDIMTYSEFTAGAREIYGSAIFKIAD